MSDSKVILVTGANKGLGLETARQLAVAGNDVIIGSRNKEKGEAAAQELKFDNLSVINVELDLKNSNSVENTYNIIEQKYGKLDVLINNAGAVINDIESERDHGINAAYRHAGKDILEWCCENLHRDQKFNIDGVFPSASPPITAPRPLRAGPHR